jgi:hypothetical protein
MLFSHRATHYTGGIAPEADSPADLRQRRTLGRIHVSDPQAKRAKAPDEARQRSGTIPDVGRLAKSTDQGFARAKRLLEEL